MARTIKLTKGKFALIDNKDFKWVSQWKWYCSSSGYAVRTVNRSGKIYLHRELLQPPKNKQVDHIDSDKLNNQRSNLRICSILENNRNRSKTKKTCTSIYKGVSHKSKGKRGKSWIAAIKHKGKMLHIGNFESEKHAARAYDLIAMQLYGKYAKTNFPQDGTVNKIYKLKYVN